MLIGINPNIVIFLMHFVIGRQPNHWYENCGRSGSGFSFCGAPPPFQRTGDKFMTIKPGDRTPTAHFKKIVSHAAREITSEEVFKGE